jgi:hypothetical protein
MFGGFISVGAAINDTWELAFAPTTATEACEAGVDRDLDGKLVGCADDGSPLAPAASCAATPACGDGVCDPVESCRSCPGDCDVGTTACPVMCGDTYCDALETTASCLGDCL